MFVIRSPPREAGGTKKVPAAWKQAMGPVGQLFGTHIHIKRAKQQQQQSLTVLGVHDGGAWHLRSSVQTSPGAQLPAYSGSPHVIVPPQPSGKLPHSTPAGHVVAGTHCSLLSATHLERSSAQTWSVGQSGPHSMVTPH